MPAGVMAGRIGCEYWSFVAEDARVGEEGLFAGKGVDVRAANADAMDAHEGFAGGRGCGK